MPLCVLPISVRPHAAKLRRAPRCSQKRTAAARDKASFKCVTRSRPRQETGRSSFSRMARARPLMSLTGHPRRVNGSTRTVSQVRSSRRIGFHCPATNISCRRTTERAALLGSGPPASRSRRRFAVSSITAALVAAVLVGVYFRSEVAAYVTRYEYAGQPNIVGGSSFGEHVAQTRLPSQGSRSTSSLALRQRAEADQAYEQTVAEKAAQATPVPEAPTTRQSVEKEHRTEVLANELAQARRAINKLNCSCEPGPRIPQNCWDRSAKATALAQEAAAARQELEEERARGTALASELATARLKPRERCQPRHATMLRSPVELRR